MNDLHLFVIPTDRPCANTIESYHLEIARLADRRRTHVLILEDRPLAADVTRANHNALNRVVAAIGVTGTLVAYADWLATMQKQQWPEYAQRLITDHEINYGRAFNKTNLIATALNAAVVHRRDSDTALPPACEEWGVFPVDYELDALAEGSCDVAGSNYWGDWNVILGDLANKPDRLRILMSAHGIPVVGQESIINDQIPRANRPPERDPGALSIGPYPDLGNCAFRTAAALDFPAPLNDSTIGTDYLLLGLAVRLHRAWVHGLRVRHQRSTDRATREYLRKYCVSRARQMDFLLLIRELLVGSPAPASYSDYSAILGLATLNVSDVLTRCHPLRLVHWAAYVEAFHGTDIDKTAGICELLTARRDDVHSDNSEQLAMYGELLRNWVSLRDRLVDAIKSLLGDRP